jgi:hypothetical protein
VRIRKPVAIGAVTAIMGLASAALVTLPASAQTTPPWEPDVNALGTLTFYNSAGTVVTSGSSLSHLFDFAEASTADTSGGTKAEMYFAAPTPGEATGLWFSTLASSGTPFPNTSAPPPLNTATNPVVTLASTDANLANFIASTVPQTAAGYANVYQVRVYTSGPGGVGTLGQGQYWDADVQVDPTTGTWQEIYPNSAAAPTSTSTTLTPSPATSAQQGATVTLTATVAASDSTQPAGSVQFSDTVGGVTSPLGSPVAVSYASSSATTGTATTSTSALLPSPPGGYSLTATFTPTNGGAETYSGSTSAGVSYTVNPVATTPAISGKHQVGQSETCSEALPDFGVTATYAWFANTTTKVGTGPKITVPASAYNKQLTCVASVSDGGGPASTATSAAVKVSLGAALKATKKPTLSGAHKVGKTETVKAGTWSVKGAKFTYQWLLNGKVIKHATKSTFKPTKGDKGKKLSCRVTASVTGYAKGSATTSSVKVSS